MLGERAAEFLNARAGSRVQIGHGSFDVLGIVRTANGFEDGGVFMPLGTAQTFFHKQGLSSVATVKLKNKENAAAFERAVQARYPNLIALEDKEFNQSLFTIQDPDSDRLGGRWMRPSPWGPRGRKYDDHVGIHQDS